ncbi:DUF1493 family protein [Desertibaculum subflavum]|uniref:DUF1493 family protein n=1 Tax=Desertibaculum subflavum TaxID=2268458 RepID=UPI000E66933B
MRSAAVEDVDAAVIIKFCSDFLGGAYPVTMHTSLNNDAGIDGIDAMEFIRRFEQEYDLTGDAFRYYDYFQDEGTTLTGMVRAVLQKLGLFDGSKKDFTVTTLVSSARAKQWVYT